MEKQRVIVYVDGFNFYYGLKKDRRWKRYYWLDVVSLFEKFMRPNQELIAVKYFSARPDNPDKNARQYSFFQANKENPKFKLILGSSLGKRLPVTTVVMSLIRMKRKRLMLVLLHRLSLMHMKGIVMLLLWYRLTVI
jgi:hypothetical protein